MSARASLTLTRQTRIKQPDISRLRAAGLVVEHAELEHYLGRHASGREASPIAVIKPRTTEDLVEVVKWARKTATALTTFSSVRGPRRTGATSEKPTLFVDLSGMDRLLYACPQDAVAVIEPGVTFGKIDELLRPHGLRAFKPLRPRAGKSIITSYLEREPNLQSSEQWDVLDPFGGTQLVFGTGETFKTGSAAIDGSLDENWKAGLRYLSAVGPGGTDFLRVVQGSQGAFAIMSWAAILCEPVPHREAARFVGSDSLEPLIKLSAELHRRRIGMATFISSNLHLASVLAKSAADVQVTALRLPRFTLYIQLTAVSEFPDEKISYQLADLDDLCKTLGLIAEPGLAGFDASMVAELQSLPADLDYRDTISGAHHSVFFLSQLDKAETFISLARELLGEDIAVYIQPRLHGRNCHIEFILPCDAAPSQQISANAAMAEKLAHICCAAGGLFSRPYGAWSDMAFARNPTIKPFLRETKSIFDPDHILNPGRLCF